MQVGRQPFATEPPVTASETRAAFRRLRDHLGRRVLGQRQLIDRLLVALLADGHLLVEGVHGLAKTTAIKALAEAVEADGCRIQFTPDLLPADLAGSEVFQAEDGIFRFQPGPLFHNLVLADEIDRAPGKVQSALLEAMTERQVRVGRTAYPLPELFLVMATQNPFERDGPHPLPEAQLDRFLMYVPVSYPEAAVECEVMRLARERERKLPTPVFERIPQETIFRGRREVLDVHLPPALEEYLATLVLATRDPSPFDAGLAGLVDWGASPRGTIALDRCSRARAWLAGRDFVTPADVHAVAGDVLRHRVLLAWEARAEGVTPDDFIAQVVRCVPQP